MGVIQRQSVKNFFSSYLGVFLGFLNIMIIQPRFLTAEELGLTRILYSFALLVASVVPLGTGNMTTRFFPEFRDEKKKHHGYFGFLMLVTLIGFILISVPLFLFREFFIGKYLVHSPLFADYFEWIFPLTLLLAYSQQLNIYCYSLYKSTVPAFINEVLIRVGVIILISLYFLKLFSFQTYVLLFVGIYGLQCMGLVAYILYEERPSIRIDWTYFKTKGWQRLAGYAMVLWMAALSATGLKELATVLLGTMVQLDLVAVYVISAFIPTLIEVPLNALDRIATFKIATAWKENNLSEIQQVYNRSSHYLFLIGSLLFLLINCNATALLGLLPEKYRDTETLIFILSVATLINMATGLNGQILFTSGRYYYAAAMLVFSVILNFFLQLAFVPWMGITGAALATALSGILTNVCYTGIVWKLFSLFPFDSTVLTHLFFLSAIYFGLMIVPTLKPLVFDLIVRSLLILVSFSVWIYKFNLMPEVVAFFRGRDKN
jgi:O-antigen/teichoic acid export membrane protein